MMAPKTRKEDRLAPPLMYAFRAAHRAGDARVDVDIRDEGGERVIASRRARASNSVSEGVLREEVLQDLQTLLNTTNLAAALDLSETPEVASSILNYGFPEIIGHTTNSREAAAIAERMVAVLKRYEPRLLSETVKAMEDKHHKAAFQTRILIEGDLRSKPVNAPVEFHADIDADSGKIEVRE
jgi:type VI secretion system protein ImpF